jgi:hypothetical protein
MKKKIPPFSKLGVNIFLTLVALSFILLNGGDTFLETSITAAANSQTSISATRNAERFRAAVAVQNRHTELLKRIPGVVGIGTGIGADGHPVIRVFTRRAGLPGIPQSLDGVPVRAKVTGMFIAFNDPTDRFDRPVPIGVSTGHPDITAGTIGARVIDGTGNVYALSNNHVYANQNYASIGDSALQPGPFDEGSYPADEIGVLYDFEPIDFSLFGSNTMDAAIVSTTPHELGTATLPEGYGTPSSIIFGDSDGDGYFDNRDDLLDLPVQKFGRTTGLTHGIVTEINVTTAVCYANCSNQYLAKLAWFEDQISISGRNAEAFSLGGDSGSLVVTDDVNKYPVGLLFAGSSTTTLANRIDRVLDRFDISIDDTEQTAPTNEICDNGLDDDGDGPIDCNDDDCSLDPICQSDCNDNGICEPDEDCYNCPNDCIGGEVTAGVCGNGVCEPGSGEDCLSCPDDCAGKQKGKPDNQFCCGDGGGENPIGCNDQRCTAGGLVCGEIESTPYCCGDLICEGIEDSVNCELDCGPPDPPDDPSGDCLPKGEVCSIDDNCCSGKCAGRKCK